MMASPSRPAWIAALILAAAGALAAPAGLAQQAGKTEATGSPRPAAMRSLLPVSSSPPARSGLSPPR